MISEGIFLIPLILSAPTPLRPRPVIKQVISRRRSCPDILPELQSGRTQSSPEPVLVDPVVVDHIQYYSASDTFEPSRDSGRHPAALSHPRSHTSKHRSQRPLSLASYLRR